MAVRDELFKETEPVGDFVFDSNVAAVFDDMLERSVPFYAEVQRMATELAVRFLGPESGVVYDIGCSTGQTLARLHRAIGPRSGVRLVGIEPSAAMRQRALENLAGLDGSERIEIAAERIEEVTELPDARVITMLYTLQFVRPIHRLGVLSMLYSSLLPGGCLILAEKVLGDEPLLRRLLIDLYHEFKRRLGYSTSEIARKREALENVLVPFNDCENLALLRQSGFEVVEAVFRWYNFAVYLAVKP
jgi:tRNA (cmo5U34)-methyltransferase